MISKVSRKKFLTNYPNFATADYRRDKYFYPDGIAAPILYVEAGSTVGICNKVASELTNLCKQLGYDSLNFLGDSNSPWLYREHDYKPVLKALNYLKENKISKSFNGAINVRIADLPEFLKHLFWLVRCNGIVFYPHFSDPGFNIMGAICQYGNIHLTTLNNATQVAFEADMQNNQLYYLQGESCGGERIPGRQFSVL